MWGKAILMVKDREAGARFAELFSKAFSGKLPIPVKQANVPVPLSINTAILGQNMNRERGGGFSAAAGGWTGTKWFPEHDGLSGEVFFNYNLAERQGEFSEKDASEIAGDRASLEFVSLDRGPDETHATCKIALNYDRYAQRRITADSAKIELVSQRSLAVIAKQSAAFADVAAQNFGGTLYL